jgi:Domain of unknown function (DUF4260)
LWLQFFLPFLVPDVSIIAYGVNAPVGTVIYNSVQPRVGPIARAAYSVSTDQRSALLVFLIRGCSHRARSNARIRPEVSNAVHRELACDSFCQADEARC